MMKRLIVLTMALAFCASTATVNAADDYTIMLISDSGYEADGILDADLKTVADGGKYVDTALVGFLGGLGYNVDTSGMGGAYRDVDRGNNLFTENEWWEGQDDRLAAIQASDLVIVSRFTSSSCYGRIDNDIYDGIKWNELSVPIINQNGQIVRMGGSRGWAWNNASNATLYPNTPTDMDIIEPDHAFVQGFTSPVTLFDWATGDARHKNGVQPPQGDYPDTAELIGILGGYVMLVDIPAGTDFDALNGTTDQYGIAGANRVYFGHWSYDVSADYSWDLDITDDYKALFAQVVAVKVPEPATIALLGLGGLALLRKRR